MLVDTSMYLPDTGLCSVAASFTLNSSHTELSAQSLARSAHHDYEGCCLAQLLCSTLEGYTRCRIVPTHRQGAGHGKLMLRDSQTGILIVWSLGMWVRPNSTTVRQVGDGAGRLLIGHGSQMGLVGCIPPQARQGPVVVVSHIWRREGNLQAMQGLLMKRVVYGSTKLVQQDLAPIPGLEQQWELRGPCKSIAHHMPFQKHVSLKSNRTTKHGLLRDCRCHTSCSTSPGQRLLGSEVSHVTST